MVRARVLDVGNCDPDHAAIQRMLADHFDADVDRVMFVDQALTQLAERTYDLVLVNRLIFADDSDGMELVRAMRGGLVRKAGAPPVMLVSNFRDAQDAAVAAGALRGFGKASLRAGDTIERLAKILPRKAG